MDLVVGLDSGTTATKAVAVAADATVVATCSAGYPLLMPAPGHAELDPVRLQQAAVICRSSSVLPTGHWPTWGWARYARESPQCRSAPAAPLRSRRRP
jgi:hypothetical protein